MGLQGCSLASPTLLPKSHDCFEEPLEVSSLREISAGARGNIASLVMSSVSGIAQWLV